MVDTRRSLSLFIYTRSTRPEASLSEDRNERERAPRIPHASTVSFGLHHQCFIPWVIRCQLRWCRETEGRMKYQKNVELVPVQRLIDWLWIVFPLNCTIKWRSADGKLMSPPMNEAVLLGLHYPVNARIRTSNSPDHRPR